MTDLQKMVNNLKESLTASPAPVGLQIAIYEGTTLRRSHGEGQAVVPKGLTVERKMTTRVRSSVGSISKTITAAAVIKALWKDQTVSLDDSIDPFIPADWKRGPNVSKLTFRMLLTHSGGFHAGDSFESLREAIAKGVLASLPSAKSDYSNGNYTLFRLILPALVYPDKVKMVSTDRELMYGELYFKACDQLILKPCGLSGVTVWQTGDKPYVQYYSNDKTQSVPDEPKEFRLKNAGAGFWFLSSREYGKLIAGLRAGKAGKEIWSSMVSAKGPGNAFQAGMFKRKGTKGVYYGHNGGWGPASGPGLRSGWLAYPDDITAVVTNNSPGAIGDALDNLVDAYDNA